VAGPRLRWRLALGRVLGPPRAALPAAPRRHVRIVLGRLPHQRARGWRSHAGLLALRLLRPAPGRADGRRSTLAPSPRGIATPRPLARLDPARGPAPPGRPLPSVRVRPAGQPRPLPGVWGGGGFRGGGGRAALTPGPRRGSPQPARRHVERRGSGGSSLVMQLQPLDYQRQPCTAKPRKTTSAACPGASCVWRGPYLPQRPPSAWPSSETIAVPCSFPRRPCPGSPSSVPRHLH
jgi:hypothetical protein